MSTFLLEIGTEEMPADFARLAVPQLQEIVANDLRQKRLSYGFIASTSTPRRISVTISDLPDKAEDFSEERKGPPSNQAFTNGSPSKAAIGFAKKYQLLPKDLEVKETSKGTFVFAKIIEKGLPTQKLLEDIVPSWINRIQGNRFMRWGVGDARFSRPIRWIVCLLDSQKLDFSLIGTDPLISSNNISRGHRLYDKKITITNPDQYPELLRSVGVLVNREERLKLINSLIDKASSELKARPDLSKDLLDELTDIVELPSLVQCKFRESFLKLPPEVLCTVMKVHQRYIPLYSKEVEKDPLALDSLKVLLPSFLCISNGLPEGETTIQKGNERVLEARFADARFFINVDLSITSSQRRDQLRSVTYASGLGTLFERVERIEWLSNKLSSILNISKEDSTHLQKAAQLCKHDLVSQMVGEFPELQGLIGGKYLLSEGEPRAVALAVLEHYMPRGSSDDLPVSLPGSLLSILDKLESLVSIFAKGERPSGSSDPYALRRSANGILQILWSKTIALDLYEMLTLSVSYWAELFPEFNLDITQLLHDLTGFFRLRIISLLEETGVDPDIVHAVAGESIPIQRLLRDPSDVLLRINVLSNLRLTGDLNGVQSVVARATRLADKGKLPLDILSSADVVDPQLFEKDSESEMLEVINKLEPFATSSSSNRYDQLAAGLKQGNKSLSNFFDGEQSVLVMTENKLIRNNRLNLLSILRNQAFQLADFSLIN